MSKFQSFDELMDALQSAVVKAHSLTQNQHILAMKDYFDEEGRPYMVKLRLPQKEAAENDEVQYREVEVPAFSLVPQLSLKMHRIKMDFDVKMVDLEKESPAADTGKAADISDSHSGRSFHLRRRASQRLLTNIFAGTNDANKVHVEMEFFGSEPPEGVMRVNDMLIRLLP